MFISTQDTTIDYELAWKNSRHFAKPPLVSPRNDARRISAETRYYWRITTQITVVFLIGRATICINQSEVLPKFREATTGFPTKWRLKNKRRNSILMTYHYPDHSSISDWSCNYLHQPIRSTTQIWVVTLHQYGISALVTKTSFREETSSDVTGNVECFLRLTTTSSSNGTGARKKANLATRGARQERRDLTSHFDKT